MKENQRIIITKKLLWEGLVRLLETRELDKISITELCERSGINRATFYRHYNTPRDILIEAQVIFAEEMYRAVNKKNIDRTSPAYLESVCTYIYDNAGLIKIFMRNNSEQELLDIMHKLIIKQGRMHEEVNGIDDVSLELVGAFVAGGSYNMLRKWLMDDIQKTPQEIAETVTLFINLVARSKTVS